MADDAKILVVDDEERNVELVEAYLVPLKYTVITALDGEAALKVLSENEIDLVLLDVMMPGMDGFEVTRRIRADEKNRLLPIVLLTALSETSDRVKGIDAGCDDFISKPFDKAELLARIKTLLKLNFYRNQLDEKEKFQKVIQEMNDGVVVCSSEWEITQANDTAKELLRLDKLAKNNVLDFLYDNYSVSLLRDELTVLDVKRRRFEAMREATEQFDGLFLEINVYWVKDNLGNVSSIVLTLRDITEARRELTVKNNFLNLISHKLWTPLTGVLEGLSILEQGVMGELNDEQKEFVDMVVGQMHRFKNLHNKLIKFANIQGQMFAVSKEKVDIRERITNIASQLESSLKGKKHEFELNFIGEQVVAPVKQLYFDAIVENLIENAFRFNDKEFTKVAVSVEIKEGVMAIQIEDNGPGIPPELRQKVFEKFYQIDRYFTGNVWGPGLGLYLVKQMVEADGGNIRLKSDVGQGTTFFINLPL